MPRPAMTATLALSVSGTTVTLSWTLNGREPNTFDVLRDSQVIDIVPGTARTYTDAGLTAGAVYVYQVRAVKGSSTELSKSVTVTIPSAPNPTAAPVLIGTAGDTQVSLSWTAIPYADSYTLQRKVGTGSYTNLISQAGLTHLNTGLTNDTLYTYRVRGTAHSGADVGPWSNEVPKTPTAASPAAPTLTGTAGDSQNSLDWNSVANAATYRLRRQVGTDPMTIWDTDATDYIDDSAVNDITYQYTVRGITAANLLGAVSNPVNLTPEADVVAEEPTYVGYAALAGVSGGGTVAATQVSNWAQLKAALLATGPRRITIAPGTGYIDGGGEIVNIKNNNLTIDGTGWAKAVRRASIRLEASNVIITQMRLWVSDQVSNPDDADALSINPGFGSSLSKVVIDHCSLLWAPDVTLAILNNSWNVTVQYSILGGGLYRSAHSEADDPGEQHSYGPNIATIHANPDPDTEYPRGITFYRNYLPHNDGRNMRGQGAENVEYVNNVVYNWGADIAHFNPRGANIVGNMFKKGDDTPATNEVLRTDTDLTYPNMFDNRLYWANNIGLNFPPTLSWDGPLRSSPYGGGLHNVTASPASSTLAASVVAGAGPSQPNSIDTALKNHFTTGTGSFYNGAGFAAPNPSWP